MPPDLPICFGFSDPVPPEPDNDQDSGNRLGVGMHYVFGWRRRLFFLLLGALLLALSLYCAVRAAWQSFVPPDGGRGSHVPQYLAVLSEDTPRTDGAASEALEAQKGKALLVLDNREGDSGAVGGFLPVLSGSEREVWEGKTIPESYLDFDPDKVMAAYERAAPESFFVHNICDGHRVSKFDSAIPGKCMVWNGWRDGALRNYTWLLSVYAVKDGVLQSFFASWLPIDAFRFIGPDLEGIVCMYDEGITAYRWDGSRYTPDESMKRSHAGVVLAVLHEGLSPMLAMPSFLVGNLVLLFWAYRVGKSSFLRATHRPYRPHGVLRICALVVFVGAFLFSSVMVWLYSMTWYGAFGTAVHLAFFAWIPIAVAAVLPNRQVPMRGIVAGADQGRPPTER